MKAVPFPDETERLRERVEGLQLDLDAIRDASATWKEDHATMENLRARFPWISDHDEDPFPAEFRIVSARIAALEAQIARLTAEPAVDEVDAVWNALGMPDFDDVRDALTAFLERRMKGC